MTWTDLSAAAKASPSSMPKPSSPCDSVSRLILAGPLTPAISNGPMMRSSCALKIALGGILGLDVTRAAGIHLLQLGDKTVARGEIALFRRSGRRDRGQHEEQQGNRQGLHWGLMAQGSVIGERPRATGAGFTSCLRAGECIYGPSGRNGKRTKFPGRSRPDAEGRSPPRTLLRSPIKRSERAGRSPYQRSTILPF